LAALSVIQLLKQLTSREIPVGTWLLLSSPCIAFRHLLEISSDSTGILHL